VIPHVTDAFMALIEAYEDLNQPLPVVLQALPSGSTLWSDTLIQVKTA